jgi:hypothetical protein
MLLIHVADKTESIPILKSDKFILTPIDESKSIDKVDVLDAISEFLASADLKENFQIIPKGNDIRIEPLEGTDMKEKMERVSANSNNPFFECTHCGFMTRYEEELKTHRLIHYI